ncbi:hypothetical protein HA49_12085 [Tatumella morbirosei]|uniref:Sorbitol dehydrogenase n=1 Tax=Tatumella morbirosei TaxID=642227 RepID=A0A095T899_9GAMM|nr:sugar dehydrogenase complex small subunit [Tatumella morbirosei]KGD72947.1 hypothetical protein HA49_12085 [Tatumella morbirosei]
MIDMLNMISRRRILQGMGALAATTLLPSGILPAFADTPANSDFNDISRLLTGRTTLSPEFSTALFSAFTKIDNHFPQKLARLKQWITANSVPAASLQKRLSADSSVADLASLPALILTGWYLGIAGSGDKAICVAYVDALANQEVAAVLNPPTYAYGAYGSWATKPF